MVWDMLLEDHRQVAGPFACYTLDILLDTAVQTLTACAADQDARCITERGHRQEHQLPVARQPDDPESASPNARLQN
jgi:hypothetical protein